MLLSLEDLHLYISVPLYESLQTPLTSASGNLIPCFELQDTRIQIYTETFGYIDFNKNKPKKEKKLQDIVKMVQQV